MSNLSLTFGSWKFDFLNWFPHPCFIQTVLIITKFFYYFLFYIFYLQNYFPVAGQTLAQRLYSHMTSAGSEIRKQECSEALSKILTSTSTSAQNRIYIEVFCSHSSLRHQGLYIYCLCYLLKKGYTVLKMGRLCQERCQRDGVRMERRS